MSIELTTAQESLRKDISKTLPLWAPYANYYDFEAELTTEIQNKDEYVKLNADTTSGFIRDGLVHTNNRLTNEGEAGVFEITGIVSLSGSPNKQIDISVFKNEQLFPCLKQSAVTGTGGRASNVSLQCLIDLDQGDFVEVFVQNASDTSNVTTKNLNITLKRL